MKALATLHLHVLDPGHGWLRRSTGSNHGLFGSARRLLHQRPLLTDGAIAAALLLVSTIWLADAPSTDAGVDSALVQTALVLPLVWRRSRPTLVFAVIAVIAFFEWSYGRPLIADGALLIALYTVAVHEPPVRTLGATAVLELGAALAATHWHPAGTWPRSFAFLTATVVAALFAGLTVRSGSEYMEWLSERAARMELERDQQASLAAAAERTRIAREMHDIVAHSLSVLVTLADAASLVNRSDPDRAADAMRHASAVGRQALGDMRTMIGVLRTDASTADLVPQPGLAELDSLFDRVRATDLRVTYTVSGETFPLGPAAELSIYRIVQESLTNTIKHASATEAHVTLDYRHPVLTARIVDNGDGNEGTPSSGPVSGHGIDGMRERVALHRGTLIAGPTLAGGWTVIATFQPDADWSGP